MQGVHLIAGPHSLHCGVLAVHCATIGLRQPHCAEPAGISHTRERLTKEVACEELPCEELLYEMGGVSDLVAALNGVEGVVSAGSGG